MNNIEAFIKNKIAETGDNLTRIVETDPELFGTLQNLSAKLKTGNIRYQEAKRIAEICGYRIEWRKTKLTEGMGSAALLLLAKCVLWK